MRLLNLSCIKSFPLLLSLILIGALASVEECHSALPPKREVVVEPSQNLLSPQWKVLWDEARELFRNKKYTQASKSYTDLLQIKPNIEEAKWELSQVLIELEDWKKSSLLLESLLENSPNRTDYLLQAGFVALKRQNFLLAIKYYGQVYENDPIGKNSNVSLDGFIKGLEGAGKKKNAYHMMEQLFQRDKNNPILLLRMANIAQELGMFENARAHYSQLIEKFEVDDTTLFKAALLQGKVINDEKSLYYWEKYLKRNPNYLPFRRKASHYLIEQGRRPEALPHLLYLLDSDGATPKNLRLIGDIYLFDLQRPDKALFYFEEHKYKYPNIGEVDEVISRIQTLLANDFISIVENDGALRLWRDLSLITPNRKAIYFTMARLLEEHHKEKELLEVLDILHIQDPKDYALTYRIALKYWNKKDVASSLKYLKRLNGYEEVLPEYVKLLAEVYLYQEKETQGLQTYLSYLQLVPDDKELRKECLLLSGKFGLIKELRKALGNYGLLYSDDLHFSEYDRLFLEGLVNNGLLDEAQRYYTKLFEKVGKHTHSSYQIRFHKANSLLQHGLVFEAEQSIREVLAEKVEVKRALTQLIEVAIEDQQLQWAKSWYYQLVEITGPEYRFLDYNEWPSDLFFIKVKILEAESRYDDVVRYLERFILESSTQQRSSRDINKARLTLIRFHYKYGEYNKCAKLLHELPEKGQTHAELAVIKNQLRNMNMSNFSTNPLDSNNFYINYIQAKFEYEYRNLDASLLHIDKALKKIPIALNARLLKSKILTSQGQYKQALDILNEIYLENNRETFFDIQVLKIEFKRGNFAKIVSKVPSNTTHDNVEQSINANQKYYFQKNLLLARSLWGDKKWDEAIQVYTSLLDISVNSIFLKKVEVEKLNFQIPPLKKSLWNVLTFTQPEVTDPLNYIMNPVFVGKNIGKPVNIISAELYGKYRWQKLIESELSVKKAMKERNYHQVEREYRALLKRGGVKDTLFDLAEVYGRLGLYGKEAELYEEIRKEGPLFPELSKQVKLNELKRKPRVSGQYAHFSKKGRADLIDIKKKSIGTEGWLMPTLRQEVNLSYFSNSYTSTDNKKSISSDRLLGSYTTNIEDSLDLNMSFGFEDLGDDGEYTILYNLEFLGRVDDLIQGHISFSQDMVDDTLEAVENEISYLNLMGGVTIDLLPRWFCGADYRYREYSDDNRQDLYSLWTSYNVYGKSNLLRIKYLYENMSNTIANIGGDSTRPYLNTNVDQSYWRPDNYWHHLLMFHFKHTFSYGDKDQKISNHYTVDYAFGYETGKHIKQNARFNIFLEMNRHLLLKGNFTFESANDYRETDLSLSLIYRW